MSVYRITRQGTVDHNVSTVNHAIQGAVPNLVKNSPATLVLHHDGSELSTYIFTDDSLEARSGAQGVAVAMGGHAQECDAPIDFRSPSEHVALLRANWFQDFTHSTTQAGAEPADIVGHLAKIVEPHSWLAITIRKAGVFERRSYMSYVDSVRDGPNTMHYLRQTKLPLACSVYAGAPSADRARSIAETLSFVLPAFDVSTSAWVPRTSAPARVWALVGIALSALWFFALPAPIEDYAQMYNIHSWAGGAGIVCLLIALLVYRGIIPTRASRLWRSLPPAPHWINPIKRTRTQVRASTESGETLTKKVYPLARSNLILSPVMAVMPFAPQAGELSGKAQARVRIAPGVVRTRIGPYLGTNNGHDVWTSDVDSGLGIAVVGSPGMGKSVYLQSFAGYFFIEQAKPSGRDGAPGKNNSVIIFEPSLQGFNDYRQLWHMVQTTVGKPNPTYAINLADKDSAHQLCLIPDHYTPYQSAAMLTDALEFATDKGSVGSASRESLMTVLSAAAWVDDDVLAAARAKGKEKGVGEWVFENGKSIITYAHILLTGAGDDAAVALASALADKLSREGASVEEHRAHSALATLFASVTPAQRKTQTLAPRNKLDRLRSLDHLFTKRAGVGQVKTTFNEILDKGFNAIIFTGSDDQGHMMSEDQESMISAMMNFALQQCIEQLCNGWGDRGRYVTPIVDEMSLMAASSSSVLEWYRDRGRKYGVRPVYATQRPAQLDEKMRQVLLTFAVFVSFKADETGVAREIADKLSSDGSLWDSTDITTLPPYTAHIMTSVNKVTQPAFTVQTPWWRDDPHLYVKKMVGNE